MEPPSEEVEPPSEEVEPPSRDVEPPSEGMEPRKDSTRAFRIMLRSRESLTAEQRRVVMAEVQRKLDDFRLASMSTTPSTTPSPYIAGYYVMTSRLVESLLRDQWRTLAASVLGVAVLLGMAFRRWRWVAAALLVNLVPLVLVLGMRGWLSGRLNMGAAMMASVSMGLAIDGSVHYLMHLRRRGRADRNALLAASRMIGGPLWVATVALAIGFGVLSLSEFVPTATFGGLLAATMVLATAANLSLLPALVCEPAEDQ